MGWRGVGASLGAAVLAGSVLMLREQVPPPEPEPETVAAAEVAVVESDRGLPVKDPVRAPRWRAFSPDAFANDGMATREHLVFIRNGESELVFTMHGRDTGDQLARYEMALDEAPWSSLLHDGLLLVLHGQGQARLAVVDPATGQATNLAAPQGYSFRGRLVALGDEVLVLGWQDGSRRSCVLGVQPRTGAARVAWCADQGRVPRWLFAGTEDAFWPGGGQSGCTRWQRLPVAGEVEPVPATATPCGVHGLIEAGGWWVALRTERDYPRPVIAASSGSRRLIIGSAGTVVSCGRHVYWTDASGDTGPDTVYRWWPGAGYREVAYRLESPGRLALAAPRCSDGVLSVAVTTAGVSPRLVEIRSLGRP